MISVNSCDMVMGNGISLGDFSHTGKAAHANRFWTGTSLFLISLSTGLCLVLFVAVTHVLVMKSTLNFVYRRVLLRKKDWKNKMTLNLSFN